MPRTGPRTTSDDGDFGRNFDLDLEAIIDARAFLRGAAKQSSSEPYEYSLMEKLVGNYRIGYWMRNQLSSDENYRSILTVEQRRKLQMLAGPHGLTIYKAMLAVGGSKP